ncbi:MAG: hypothetical protein ABL952_02900 [Pyrinomonadaceae bacterium]
MSDQTFLFRDSISNEEAVVIVRRSDESVGICLSLESNGDTEVFLNPTDLRKLIQALENSLAV